MIRMPRKIRIASHVWTIVRKPARGMYMEGESCRGLCVADKFEIWLFRDLGLAKAQEYLCHELLHACAYSFVTGKAIKEEVFVTGMTLPFLSMLRDNPGLIAYLAQK
jgi:hypothetical protein